MATNWREQRGNIFKSIDTPTLVELNFRAVARNYNRSLTDEFIQKLDPDGWHITVRQLAHEHAMGVKVAPHWRAQLFCKLTGRGVDDPQEVWLDIAADDFEALEECESVERGTAPVVLKPFAGLPPFARYTTPQMLGPYGTNIGDIWSAEDSPVGKEMLAKEGLLLIHEMMPDDDDPTKPVEKLYSVKLDNPKPEMQDLIKRARDGVELYWHGKARSN
jgi:hypothetical protein